MQPIESIALDLRTYSHSFCRELMRVFLDLVSLKSRCTAVMQYSAIKCWTTIRWVAPFCPHAYSISSSHVKFRRVCKYDCTYVRHARIRPTTRAACCQAKRTLLSLLIALCLHMWAGQTFTHTRTHTRTRMLHAYMRTCVRACVHSTDVLHGLQRTIWWVDDAIRSWVLGKHMDK